MRPMGKRTKGEIYISGGSENRDLHKAKYFDGKRFMVRRIFLSKPEADGAADAHRAQGHLARVVPRMVWINRAGWELGMEKVQGYVLYVHYTTDEEKEIKTLRAPTTWKRPMHEHEREFNKTSRCRCGSKKSTFSFEGKQYCSDCAPINVGD